MRRAFTYIELIVTMVILGIVAYVSTGLIAKIYIGYNQTNTVNRANQKLENALSIIANRLNYAVPKTIIKRRTFNIDTFFPISSAPTDYEVLEWIGYAKDSFNVNEFLPADSLAPAWSGFCDIKRSSKNSIITPGSNLNFANKIIKILSEKKASLNTQNSVAVFFPGNYDYKNIGFFSFGFIPFNNNGTTRVLAYNPSGYPDFKNAQLNITNTNRIVEVYKLSWSAYAVVPTNCKTEDNIRTCDLELRYNYRPWLNENYKDNAKSSLITTGVTVFKTYATENRIHIKLCVKDRYLEKKTISICKEKVVYR